MPTKLSNIGEFGLIDLIKKQVRSSRSVIKGIGDDTAVVSFSSNKNLLLTTDMLIEGVHFTRKMPPKGIGHKALACNISDIAAMGGRPKYALVSLGVSGKLEWRFVQRIYQGMQQCARTFGVKIVGGDTVKSSKIIINVSLIGEAKKNELITRNGAKKKDQIFVTGPLGKSLKSGWHLKFLPRIRESQYLVKHFHPTAMIDISDGLAADLGQILKASQTGAMIYEDRIPKRPNATLKEALYDGEDFELLFTLRLRDAQRLNDRTNEKFKFYPIGEIIAKKATCCLTDRKGKVKQIQMQGFVHF